MWWQVAYTSSNKMPWPQSNKTDKKENGWDKNAKTKHKVNALQLNAAHQAIVEAAMDQMDLAQVQTMMRNPEGFGDDGLVMIL